jgi:hypothetical protein
MLVVALVLASAAVVGAQDPEETAADQPFRWVERLREAIAEALGITVEEYEGAVDTAKERVLEESVEEGWLTEEQAERVGQRLDAGPGKWRFAVPHLWSGPVRTELSLEGMAAEQLGLALDELRDALQDGKTIAELAEEGGVEPQAIVDAYVKSIGAELEQAVADEQITQMRADAILERIEQQALAHLERSYPCRFGPFSEARESLPHMERRGMPRGGRRGLGRGPF